MVVTVQGKSTVNSFTWTSMYCRCTPVNNSAFQRIHHEKRNNFSPQFYCKTTKGGERKRTKDEGIKGWILISNFKAMLN